MTLFLGLVCICAMLRAEQPDGIRRLSPFESWHSARHYPYIGFGHRLREGEKLTADITEAQADSLLRADLAGMCALFRHLGKDSLLLGCLAYQVGPYRLLGHGRMPKSTLIRKLESGDRNIYREFTAYRCYNGKPVASIQRRREMEFEMLFVP